MKTKIYCLASAKGGSGKTVLCASFAAFLADLGKKVLIIDLDAATHGLTLLYLNEVNFHREEIATSEDGRPLQGIFDTGEFSWETDVVQLPNGVSLVPATFSFSIKDSPSEIDLKSRLKALLTNAKERFDYVFLDAQAGADSCSQVAMSKDVSFEVVIVSEYDPLSAAGVERLKALLRDDLLYARTWTLLNKMLPDFVATFSEFLEVSKYLTPIPWDADVVRAYARRRLPLDLDYGNQFTLAIMQSLKKLIGEDLASEIDKWAEGRASSIREPIEEQYRDAEIELKGLMQQKVFLERKTAYKKFMRSIRIALVPMVVLLTLSFYFVENPVDLLGPFYGTGLRRSTVIAILMTIVAIGLMVIAFTTQRWDRSAEREVEEARFMRQLSIVEERLKKLEVLRKADLKTLVKAGPNQQ